MAIKVEKDGDEGFWLNGRVEGPRVYLHADELRQLIAEGQKLLGDSPAWDKIPTYVDYREDADGDQG